MMKKIRNILTALLALTSLSAYAADLPGGGTLNNPYTISSKNDWNTFMDHLSVGGTSFAQGNTSYEGKYIKLMADITVLSFLDETESDRYSPFKGIFDGNGHSITLDYTSNSSLNRHDYIAPFRYAKDATIMNLHVKGEIDARDIKGAAGVIGYAKGYNRIINCRSSVIIDAPSTKNDGGFVGHIESDGTTEIINCLFDGSISGKELYESGGFVGWAASDSHLYILNSLFAPTKISGDESNTFFRKKTSASAILANCYYKTVWNNKPQTDHGAIDARSMSDTELLRGLGGGWHREGNTLVPTFFNIYGDLVGAGTQENPYVIGSVDHWNTLAFRIRSGESFSGKYFLLLSDLAVNLQLGSDASHPFSGHFDGRGRTLTFTRTSAADYCAPFRYVKDATIRNIRIKGTVYTNHMDASGLVGYADGSLSLSQCWSSVKIDSRINGDGTHGGLISRVAKTATSITLTDALFDGKFHQGKSTKDPGDNVTTTHCGGLIGWAYVPVTFTNCLFNPEAVTIGTSGAQKMVRYDSGANPTFNQSYYLSSWGAGNQGSDASGMTVDELVAALGANWENVGGKAVLKYAEIPDFAGKGTQADPYLITSAVDWDKLEIKNKSTSPFPDGSYFKLTANITVTSPVGSSEDNPFNHYFDGDGHTLDLALTTTNANYTAPFGYIRNAHLSNLVLTGSVSTTGMRPSGLVGFVYGENTASSIENCRSSVAISSSRNGDVDGGAFVGTVWSNASISLTGCVFTGTVEYTNTNGYEGGGMIGWARKGPNTQVNLTDCVFAPAAFHAKAGSTEASNYLLVSGDVSRTYVTISRAYYNHVAYSQDGIDPKHGFDAGTLHACAVRVGSNHVNAEPYGIPTVYDVARITLYDSGSFVHEGVIYGPGGGSILLSINSDAYSDFIGTDGEDSNRLSGDGNPYTLTFHNADVEIKANFGAITIYEDRDNTEVLTGAHTTSSVVTMNRTMLAGVWNSFCAPFSLTAEQIATVFGEETVVKEISSATYDNESGLLTLNFSTVSLIDAGHPYLVKIGSTSDVVNPNFGSVTIHKQPVKAVCTAADFVPVFGITPENGTTIDTRLAGSDESVLFIAGDGSLSYPDANGNIKAFRAYIKVK